MSKQVTLDLPEEILGRAERLAVLTHREVTSVLVDALKVTIPPLEWTCAESPAASSLSDKEILSLCELRLPPEQKKRLERLLELQQERDLHEREHKELAALMEIYETKWLQQAEALAEAVRRGLREPLAL